MLKSSQKLVAMLALAMLFAVSAVLAEEAPDSIPGTTKVTAEDAVDLIMSDPSLVVIDARKASDREEAGWIEGSIGLPNYDTTPESLAKYLKTKETPVLFYCNGVKCGRSVDSSKIAIDAGYSKIYWFRGGWEEWTAKGMPVANN